MCVNLATEGGHEGIRTPASNADPSVMQSPIREIPEFPVRENSGYDKPFPHRALLF